jgi:hypothetical protein
VIDRAVNTNRCSCTFGWQHYSPLPEWIDTELCPHFHSWNFPDSMVHDVELHHWSFTSSAGKIITSKNKIMKYLFAIFALASFSMFTQASAFEIGVVDLNQALNHV